MASNLSTSSQQFQQVQSTIFKFDGRTDFVMWKRLTELFLRSSGYGEILEKGLADTKEGEDLSITEKQQIRMIVLLMKKPYF